MSSNSGNEGSSTSPHCSTCSCFRPKKVMNNWTTEDENDLKKIMEDPKRSKESQRNKCAKFNLDKKNGRTTGATLTHYRKLINGKGKPNDKISELSKKVDNLEKKVEELSTEDKEKDKDDDKSDDDDEDKDDEDDDKSDDDDDGDDTKSDEDKDDDDDTKSDEDKDDTKSDEGDKGKGKEKGKRKCKKCKETGHNSKTCKN